MSYQRFVDAVDEDFHDAPFVFIVHLYLVMAHTMLQLWLIAAAAADVNCRTALVHSMDITLTITVHSMDKILTIAIAR